MKKVVRDFWLSRGTLVAIGSLILALILMMGAIMDVQRREYQRTTDAAAIRLMHQIDTKIESLRIQNESLLRSQAQTIRSVDEVKEAVVP